MVGHKTEFEIRWTYCPIDLKTRTSVLKGTIGGVSSQWIVQKPPHPQIAILKSPGWYLAQGYHARPCPPQVLKSSSPRLHGDALPKGHHAYHYHQEPARCLATHIGPVRPHPRFVVVPCPRVTTTHRHAVLRIHRWCLAQGSPPQQETQMYSKVRLWSARRGQTQMYSEVRLWESVVIARRGQHTDVLKGTIGGEGVGSDGTGGSETHLRKGISDKYHGR